MVTVQNVPCVAETACGDHRGRQVNGYRTHHEVIEVVVVPRSQRCFVRSDAEVGCAGIRHPLCRLPGYSSRCAIVEEQGIHRPMSVSPRWNVARAAVHHAIRALRPGCCWCLHRSGKTPTGPRCRRHVGCSHSHQWPGRPCCSSGRHHVVRPARAETQVDEELTGHRSPRGLACSGGIAAPGLCDRSRPLAAVNSAVFPKPPHW